MRHFAIAGLQLELVRAASLNHISPSIFSMKTTRLLAVLLLLLTTGFSSCTKDSTDVDYVIGAWYNRSQFEGLARSGAVSFVVGDKAYVGLGTDGTDKYTDFWEFTPSTNTWRQRASFPGVGRYQAVAFAANGKGYVGTGYDGLNRLKDFWEYDPATNAWTQKADFGGSARYGAVALSLNDKGYVGTGYDGNYKKDFWQYDPLTDVWAQKPSFGGNKRVGATAFVVNNEGYILTGLDNGTCLTDNWSYNPTTETWTEHRKLEGVDTNGDGYNFSAVPRAYGVSFAIGNTGYVALGSKDAVLSNCWAYSPTDDNWYEKTDFAGSGRTSGVGFALGDYGYITLGASGTARFDDLWVLEPTVDAD
jgi:N-acetylneuraminic acid mutarotase